MMLTAFSQISPSTLTLAWVRRDWWEEVFSRMCCLKGPCLLLACYPAQGLGNTDIWICIGIVGRLSKAGAGKILLADKVFESNAHDCALTLQNPGSVKHMHTDLCESYVKVCYQYLVTQRYSRGTPDHCSRVPGDGRWADCFYCTSHICKSCFHTIDYYYF